MLGPGLNWPRNKASRHPAMPVHRSLFRGARSPGWSERAVRLLLGATVRHDRPHRPGHRDPQSHAGPDRRIPAPRRARSAGRRGFHRYSWWHRLNLSILGYRVKRETGYDRSSTHDHIWFGSRQSIQGPVQPTLVVPWIRSLCRSTPRAGQGE